MEHTAHEYLIGKSRKEVIAELGQEFNYYHNQEWSYELKKNWFGRHIILIIVFDEGRVVSVFLKKKYYV